MGHASTEEITSQGYEPPQNTQFSVFLPNKVGRLLELVELFEGQALVVAALSVLDSADHAVVRLLTSRASLARRLLDRGHMSFSECDVLVVELDAVNTLSRICSTLLQAELNIHFAYPLMVRPHGHSALALCCDNYVLAGNLLRRRHFTLLAENDLGENLNPGDVFPND